jgi:hypothetical protein
MTGQVVSIRPAEALQFYDVGCKAIAQAKRVDEVKDIADKAKAMKVYARQKRNLELEADAIVIRIRATRKIGKLAAEMQQEGRLSELGGDRRSNQRVNSPPETFASMGIDKNTAKDARRLAGVPESTFETKCNQMHEKICSGKVKGATKTVFPPTLRTQPPDINIVISQSWRFWDKLRTGKEIEKLKEIINHQRYAEQVGIDHLKLNIERMANELIKLGRKL